MNIRGDEDDPFSRGHICPKAVALKDVHEDPDRLRRPLRRTATGLARGGLGRGARRGRRAALRRAAGARPERGRRLPGQPDRPQPRRAALRPAPASRSLRHAQPFTRPPRWTSSRRCSRPRSMFGHQLLLPVPDIDRTDFLLILGANPLASNGSLMTAPGVEKRLKAIRARGGRRRGRGPAAHRDRGARRPAPRDPARHRRAPAGGHAAHAVRRGPLAAGRLARVHGRPRCARRRGPARSRRRRWPPHRRRCGRDSRDWPATSPRPTGRGRYGRVGRLHAGVRRPVRLAHQRAEHRDRQPRPGRGARCSRRPAVDVVGLADRLGQRGHFDKGRSRVRGLPEFGGEWPVADAGRGDRDARDRGRSARSSRIAGNPVLSTPNGARLDRALAGLDFMVSIDIYLNETTRHAHLILPPTFAPRARPLRPRLPRPRGAQHRQATRRRSSSPRPERGTTGEILRRSARRASTAPARARSLRSRLDARAPARGRTRRRSSTWLLRFGPYGAGLVPFGGGLDPAAGCTTQPHGVDLGPLEPCLPGAARHTRSQADRPRARRAPRRPAAARRADGSSAANGTPARSSAGASCAATTRGCTTASGW